MLDDDMSISVVLWAAAWSPSFATKYVLETVVINQALGLRDNPGSFPEISEFIEFLRCGQYQMGSQKTLALQNT